MVDRSVFLIFLPPSFLQFKHLSIPPPLFAVFGLSVCLSVCLSVYLFVCVCLFRVFLFIGMPQTAAYDITWKHMASPSSQIMSIDKPPLQTGMQGLYSVVGPGVHPGRPAPAGGPPGRPGSRCPRGHRRQPGQNPLIRQWLLIFNKQCFYRGGARPKLHDFTTDETLWVYQGLLARERLEKSVRGRMLKKQGFYTGIGCDTAPCVLRWKGWDGPP
jgi:hypothetical protein